MSSHSEPERTRPKTSSSTSRRHREPEWVARPRNAFIIFRCEYAQKHRRQGPRIRRPPGSSTDPTLSKRAAIAWSRMSEEEKEPYKLRAEEERADHARQYPQYRYRPHRKIDPNDPRYYSQSPTAPHPDGEGALDFAAVLLRQARQTSRQQPSDSVYLKLDTDWSLSTSQWMPSPNEDDRAPEVGQEFQILAPFSLTAPSLKLIPVVRPPIVPMTDGATTAIGKHAAENLNCPRKSSLDMARPSIMGVSEPVQLTPGMGWSASTPEFVDHLSRYEHQAHYEVEEAIDRQFSSPTQVISAEAQAPSSACIEHRWSAHIPQYPSVGYPETPGVTNSCTSCDHIPLMAISSYTTLGEAVLGIMADSPGDRACGEP